MKNSSIHCMMILLVIHMKINIRHRSRRKDLRRNFSRIGSEVDVIPFLTMKFLAQKQEELNDNLDEFQKEYGFTFRDYELLTNIIKKYDKNEDSCLSDVKSALNVLKNSKNQDIKEIFSRVDDEKITKNNLNDIMDIIEYDDNLTELFKLVNYNQETYDNAVDRIIPPTIDLLSKLATINHEVKEFYDPSSMDAQTVTALEHFDHATLYLKNDADYIHAKQNLLINGISSDKVSLYKKEILIDEDSKKYDTIVSVPFEKRLKRNDKTKIKKYDKYITKSSNSIHLLNLIEHMDDNGIIVTTTTQDLLVKSDAQQLRQCLIENNLLDVVIDYDSGFRSRDIIILILNKNKESEDFLFIKPKHLLPGLLLPSEEQSIFKSYENREIIPKFSNIIDKDEIIKNDYNLNPKRYVYTLDYEKQSIEDILNKQKKCSDRIKELDQEIEAMLQKR